MAKYRIVAKCTITDELELSQEPTGSELLDVLRDVNEQFAEIFKAKGLKVQADEIMITLVENDNGIGLEPIESDLIMTDPKTGEEVVVTGKWAEIFKDLEEEET